MNNHGHCGRTRRTVYKVFEFISWEKVVTDWVRSQRIQKNRIETVKAEPEISKNSENKPVHV